MATRWHRNFYGRVWLTTLDELGLTCVRTHVLRHSTAFTLTVYGHILDTDSATLPRVLMRPASDSASIGNGL